MLMVGFRGYSLGPGDPTYERVRAGLLGNVVLFDYDGPSSGKEPRNIQSAQQVKSLDTTLQAAAPRRLLIAADQEGGYVARLSPKYGFPSTYSEQEIGERGDLSFTREAATAMGATLKEAGINLNLAPVVDVNVNPENPVIGYYERSFSADPDAVTRQALAFIEGHHKAGVLTTLKHFPGHGSSQDDSHEGFVDVTDLWSERELIPFRDVIVAGKADAVMTAHIFNAHLDPKYPATLSKATITGILRERLGFDGVVITDDMLMGAISQHYGFEEAIELAIDAGCDILAVSNNLSYENGLAERTFHAVRNSVLAGRISERRIDQSYERILALKNRLG
jgi:beta-N-acetylhexosaminidase